jgi:Domain of unknown function (DUF4116)
LRQDREFILQCVKLNGNVLSECPDEFERSEFDQEIVLNAVKQYGTALEYADPALRKNREVVSTAIKQSVSAIQYASSDLKQDLNFIFECVQQHVVEQLTFPKL